MTIFETVNGYLWPSADTECRKVVFDWSSDLDIVFEHVNDWTACVQAGGNCGVWPKLLAQKFGTVYTFEPDPANFHCLARNCDEFNIVKMQAALGMERPPISLAGEAKNCGALHIGGDGFIPVIEVDWLHLPSCGMIYLDIEGYEAHAILGASETIKRCKPVIAIENKGLSSPYGYSPKGVEQIILDMGYKVVARPHRDVVFIPC